MTLTTNANKPNLTLQNLILAAVPVIGAAAIGNLATLSNIKTWYLGLVKPALNPPSWIFGPVWGLLYIMMIIAFWRILSTPKSNIKYIAIGLFLEQMALNAFWSVAFFGMHSPIIGLGVISALWLSIALTIAIFSKLDKIASYLLIPYLMWVSFATYLNAGIWWLNR